MAASGLVGLAVTYYFDDPANEKLNTILKVGLQLVGLAMISLSSAAPEVSVGVAAALALSHVLHLPRCDSPAARCVCQRPETCTLLTRNSGLPCCAIRSSLFITDSRRLL